MNLVKEFWNELKQDLSKNTIIRTLFFIGTILIGLIIAQTLLSKITTILEIPLRVVFIIFAIIVTIELFRKKQRTIQDYLITLAIIAVSLIYPTIANQTQLLTNEILIVITVFLALFIIILWEFTKKTSKTSKKQISFISILILIFFIIILYSWAYTLLIISGSTGGLAFGGCSNNDNITPENNANTHTLYFSAITFTTLGYGDICPQGKRFRTLAALEAISGILSIPTMFYIITKPD